MACRYDEDGDGVLTPTDLERLFTPLPDATPVWDACTSLLCAFSLALMASTSPSFPDNVALATGGGLPIDVFLGLWCLLLRYERTRTLYAVLQLGYWRAAQSLVRWVEPGAKGAGGERQTVHCCVVGQDGIGKVRVARRCEV